MKLKCSKQFNMAYVKMPEQYSIIVNKNNLFC